MWELTTWLRNHLTALQAQARQEGYEKGWSQGYAEISESDAAVRARHVGVKEGLERALKMLPPAPSCVHGKTEEECQCSILMTAKASQLRHKAVQAIESELKTL